MTLNLQLIKQIADFFYSQSKFCNFIVIYKTDIEEQQFHFNLALNT